MDKETKQELKYLGIKFGAILLFCLMIGFAYAYIQTSQYEKESQNRASMEAFSRCVSDGSLYWNSEEQRCYEKEPTENKCILLREWDKIETTNLPDYINRSGIVMNISECNTTLTDSEFMCNGLKFWVWSILEDVTYQICINGFTIGMHDKYGYQDVRYLGKYENASDYKGMVVIPFDEDKCKIAYYRVYNKVEENVEVCWK